MSFAFKLKVKRKSSRSSQLKKINSAKSQLKKAYNLILSQQMEADYIDTAMAQIAVAYLNLEIYSRHILNALPEADNELLALARSMQPKRLIAGPSLLTRETPSFINVSADHFVDANKMVGGAKCQ